jgi:hypothetical protein
MIDKTNANFDPNMAKTKHFLSGDPLGESHVFNKLANRGLRRTQYLFYAIFRKFRAV